MKNINTIRVFFAVLPTGEACDSLCRLIAILKKRSHDHSIRWTPVKNLHITLQFLKDLQQKHTMPLIEEVRAQLKKLSIFQLQLGQLYAFPTVEHPRIISLTVEPQTALMTLSDTIGNTMRGLGYPVESRPFQGHITIARLPHNKLQADLFSHLHLPVVAPIPVHEIYLIESRPDKVGSKYITLDKFNLNQNQPESDSQ